MRYRNGEEPRVNDSIRLVDVDRLWTQMDQPAEAGEYVVDDICWGQLLLLSDSAAIWCDPGRCEKRDN